MLKPSGNAEAGNDGLQRSRLGMDSKKPGENPYVQVIRFSSIIFLLPACLVGGYFVGEFLDQKLGTNPWLTFLFLALGGAAGLLQTFRMLSR